MKLSVIIPIYNEEKNINKLHQDLNDALKSIIYELIFINDGSDDNSFKELNRIYNEDKKHVKIINFSRNFGKESAMYAGLIHAVGDYSAIIDGDNQQDPKYLMEMAEFLDNNEDYDQVVLVNEKRKNNGFFKKIASKIFYKIIDKLSDIKFASDASDFRMFRKYVTESICSLNEINRFSKGIFSWVGFKTKYLPYTVKERIYGKTNYNFRSSLKYAWEGIIGFSIKPLKIATFFGIFTSLGSFIYLIIIIIKTLILGVDVPGYASLMGITLLMGGIQLLCIGILGEYLARTYLETKKRPIYVAKNKIGFK